MPFFSFVFFRSSPAVAIPFVSFPEPAEPVHVSEKDVPRYIFIARQKLKAGKFREVVEICNSILAVKEDSVEAHAYLAGAYMAMGKNRLYKKEVLVFKRLAPHSPLLSLSMAETFQALGDMKKAEAEYREGIRIAPDDTRLHMGLGALYVATGDIRQAKDQYLAVVRKKKVSPQDFMNASFALCRIGLREKAYDRVIKRAGMVMELYPPIPLSYEFMARAYLAKGLPRKAVDIYKRLLKTNRDIPLPYQKLAIIYSNTLKDNRTAMKYAKDGVRLFPRDPVSYDVLGWVCFSAGDNLMAIKHFEQAVRLDCKNPVYHYHTGLAFQREGKRPKALASFSKAPACRGQWIRKIQA